MLLRGLKEFFKTNDKIYLVGGAFVLIPFAIFMILAATYNIFFMRIGALWFVIFMPFMAFFLPWYDDYIKKNDKQLNK